MDDMIIFYIILPGWFSDLGSAYYTMDSTHRIKLGRLAPKHDIQHLLVVHCTLPNFCTA